MTDKKVSGPVRVVSDGNGVDTAITLADGTVLEGVTSLTLWMEPFELNRVDLTVVGVSVDIKAHVDSVDMNCPVCGDAVEHRCKTLPTTMSGA